MDTMQSYTLSAGDNKIDLYSCVINSQTVPFGVNVIAFHKRHPFCYQRQHLTYPGKLLHYIYGWVLDFLTYTGRPCCYNLFSYLMSAIQANTRSGFYRLQCAALRQKVVQTVMHAVCLASVCTNRRHHTFIVGYYLIAIVFVKQ